MNFFHLARLTIISLSLVAGVARADLRLATPFGDHMVVQHDKPLTVWGWDEPGRDISLSFGDTNATATAGKDGRWEAKIAPPTSEGPHELRVAGSSTLTVKDVLIGEVWLASGQSNMEFPVRATTGAEETIREVTNSRIRFLNVPNVSTDEPQVTADAKWTVISPETVGDVSGVAYFFAKRLESELDRPVGILQADWGGSMIRAWIPADVMAKQPGTSEVGKIYARAAKDLNEKWAAWIKGGKQGDPPPANGGAPQHGVSMLDNGMIQPLVPYPIMGVIWYQGESDAGDSVGYRREFALLVNSWRERFRDADLPVYFAQLPNFQDDFAEFRYQQSLLPTEVANTAYAVLIDAGIVDNIHPPDKKTPGYRLAQLALAKTYRRDLVPGGPIPIEPVVVIDSTITVRFENAGGGLKLKPIEAESPFRLRFTDGTENAITPEILGGNALMFSVPVGKSVRELLYADSNDPPAVLYNVEGFPGTPFRLELSEATQSSQ